MNVEEGLEKLSNMSSEELDTIMTNGEVDFSKLGIEPEKETEEEKEVVTEEVSLDPEEEEENKQEEPEVDAIDYKKAYEEALAPFKAAGTEISVSSIEELKKLASMGVDYTRKTQELSKDRVYIEALKNNNLLDENKLNLVIEIAKGNKDALAAHIKALGIDPYDIDVTDENKEYKINNNIKSVEEQQRLDYYINNIINDDAGKSFIKDIEENWDSTSIAELNSNLSVVAALKHHYNTGVYSRVQGEIAKQRALGNLNGYTQAQSYEIVYKHLYPQNIPQPEAPLQKTPIVQQEEVKTKLNNSDKINALSPLRNNPVKTSKTVTIEDLATMSTEEFNKYYAKLMQSKN